MVKVPSWGAGGFVRVHLEAWGCPCPLPSVLVRTRPVPSIPSSRAAVPSASCRAQDATLAAFGPQRQVAKDSEKSMMKLKIKIDKNKAIPDAERRKLDSEAHEHFIKHGNRNHGGSSENKPSEDRTQVLISPLHPHHRALDAGAHPPLLHVLIPPPREDRTQRRAGSARVKLNGIVEKMAGLLVDRALGKRGGQLKCAEAFVPPRGQSVWPPWRRHSWPPRAREAASEGSGPPSARGREARPSVSDPTERPWHRRQAASKMPISPRLTLLLTVVYPLPTLQVHPRQEPVHLPRAEDPLPGQRDGRAGP